MIHLIMVLSDLQREEDPLVEDLRVQLAQKERELQVMKEGAEELNSLRQQNYLLQSKVHKHRSFPNKIFIPCHVAMFITKIYH